jgi:hypothetical protein
MKLRTSMVSAMGLSLVVALLTLGACGGDKSTVNATGGAANNGGSGNTGGNASDTGGNATAGGTNGAGGTTSTVVANPYTWGFYQDSEGWGTGVLSGTETASAGSVQNVSYCNGGCADVKIVFNGDPTQTVNFMKYWSTPYPDFTGNTITAGIKIDDPSGVITDIELHPQSGATYSWGPAFAVNGTSNPTLASIIASTTAVTITTPVMAAAAPFDPTQIQGIGFNINGKAGTSGTAHLYVDSVTVQ